jgi:hypothetical protein
VPGGRVLFAHRVKQNSRLRRWTSENDPEADILLQFSAYLPTRQGAGSYRMPPLNLGEAMKRRDFMAGLGIAAALPAISRAQQTVPTVGFLSTRSSNEAATHPMPFAVASKR